MYNKEEFRKEMDKREFFNEKKADEATLEFRRLCQKHRDDLVGTCIQTGNTNWYFMGAGSQKLMLGTFTSGADCKHSSLGKNWIVWGNENPIIRKVLLSEIAKIELAEENGLDEKGDVLDYQEIKRQIAKEVKQKARTKEEPAQGLPTEFTRASEL